MDTSIQTTDKKKGRQNWIDIAKGIGILATLLGHSFPYTFMPIIYSFHMPLFFILAGYTAKRIERSDMGKAVFKDFKRLIIPCIIARLLIFLGKIIISGSPVIEELRIFFVTLLWGNHVTSFFGMKMPLIGRVWFLTALFFARLIYRILLLKFDDKSRFAFLLTMSVVSLFLGAHKIFLPQNLDMMFICLLFMEVGHWLKENGFERFRGWVLLVLFTLWTYLSCKEHIYMIINKRKYPGYGLCIFVAIAGCICIFLFSQSIENFKLSKILMFFGRNSMILLVIHTVTPFFYKGTTHVEILACMAVQLLLVVIYVPIRSLFIKLYRNQRIKSS